MTQPAGTRQIPVTAWAGPAFVCRAVREERGKIYCAPEVLEITNRYNENDGVSKSWRLVSSSVLVAKVTPSQISYTSLSQLGSRVGRRPRPKPPRYGPSESGSGGPGLGSIGCSTALGSAETPSLLDGASHGPAGRWVLLRRVR